jgi:hypothetical protein
MRGDVAAAEGDYRRALAMSRAEIEPTNPALAVPLLGLGRLELERGRRQAAEPLLREARALLLAANGADHARTPQAASWLAACRAGAGDPAARAELGRALATLERLLPSSHPHVRDARRLLAEVAAPAAPAGR